MRGQVEGARPTWPGSVVVCGTVVNFKPDCVNTSSSRLKIVSSGHRVRWSTRSVDGGVLGGVDGGAGRWRHRGRHGQRHRRRSRRRIFVPRREDQAVSEADDQQQTDDAQQNRQPPRSCRTGLPGLTVVRRPGRRRTAGRTVARPCQPSGTVGPTAVSSGAVVGNTAVESSTVGMWRVASESAPGRLLSLHRGSGAGRRPPTPAWHPGRAADRPAWRQGRCRTAVPSTCVVPSSSTCVAPSPAPASSPRPLASAPVGPIVVVAASSLSVGSAAAAAASNP